MRHPDLVADPTDVRLVDLIPSWDALAESTGGSFFQTGTWAMAWWAHLARRPETCVGLWLEPSGDVEAVVALSKIRQPLLRGSGPAISVWTNTGSGAGAADHLGWPARSHLRSDVMTWATATASGPLVLSNLAPDQVGDLSEQGFALVEDSPTLAAELGNGDDWFPGSTDFRKKLRYASRQLAKAGVVIDVVGSDTIDRALFSRLLELHAARSENMGWDTHFDADRLEFHMDLIRSSSGGRSSGGWSSGSWGPVACVARQGETVVGVLYGFRFGGSFAYYQTGWSGDYVRQSLGSVLVATAMEWAAADGAVTFDFLRGDDEYKRRFGATPRVDQTWMLARGIGGRALKARQAAAGRTRRQR